MRSSSTFRIAPLAALLIASPLAAQQQLARGAAVADARTVRLGVAGGVVIPRTGASARTLENGLHGQAFALVRLPGGLPALRLNVDYARMKFGHPTTSTGSAAAADADRTMLDGVAGMRLDLLKGPVRPYVVAGVGAFNVRDRLRDAALATSTGGSTAAGAAALEQSTTNFGVDGGAGISFRLGRLDGFVETRLQNVYTRKQGLVDAKSIQAFPVAFGLTF